MRAFLGHVEGRSLDARRLVVERARDQPCGGGLADAANPGEHVGLRDASRGERILERPHHGVLADQLGEDLGPVFAGECRVAFGMRLCRERGRGVSLGTLARAFLLILHVGHGQNSDAEIFNQAGR